MADQTAKGLKDSMSDIADKEKTCVICYNDFGVESPEGINEVPFRLPRCKHIFGDHCIKRWFEDSDRCPYCRDKVRPDPKHYPNSSRAFMNIMRLRGAYLPSALSEQLYSRFIEMAGNDNELIDALARQDRVADRRSPPDDDTGLDQRRTRQRRSSRSPRRPHHAAARESRSAAVALPYSTMPTPDLYTHPLSETANPWPPVPLQVSHQRHARHAASSGTRPLYPATSRRLPVMSVAAGAYRPPGNGQVDNTAAGNEAYGQSQVVPIIPFYQATPMSVAGLVVNQTSPSMFHQQQYVHTPQAAGHAPRPSTQGQLQNPPMQNPPVQNPPVQNPPVQSPPVQFPTRETATVTGPAGIHMPSLRPARTTDAYPGTQAPWVAQTTGSHGSQPVATNNQAVPAVSSDVFRALPW
ncbi:hypothetical protein CDD82_6250 [Ophiocordyceps australis]|uniref:RING-type domain-containing protein n=1 Tax=Ophiocordyceps australis TaxID=1399860 RepID=A0A2C5YY16_9HYPO|nr:hypothetical protein CDD82_6250 [Ophiocordyceps australis]